MALLTNRVLMRKCAPFYSRVQRASEDGSDSEGPSIRSHSRSTSFTWLHRACSSSNGHSSTASVPLSESPKRELRMRSASKVSGRHHHQHPAKKQKKQASFSKLMWW